MVFYLPYSFHYIQSILQSLYTQTLSYSIFRSVVRRQRHVYMYSGVHEPKRRVRTIQNLLSLASTWIWLAENATFGKGNRCKVGVRGTEMLLTVGARNANQFISCFTKKKHCLSITKTIRSMLFMEIVALCFENLTKRINKPTLFGIAYGFSKHSI